MQEKRASPRIRVFKSAVIDYGLGGLECTVGNLSAHGAMVEIIDPSTLPERFNLTIPSEGMRRSYRAVWRHDRRLGVAFASDARFG
jgi:hypothetical protein